MTDDFDYTRKVIAAKMLLLKMCHMVDDLHAEVFLDI